MASVFVTWSHTFSLRMKSPGTAGVRSEKGDNVVKSAGCLSLTRADIVGPDVYELNAVIRSRLDSS